MVRSDSVEAPEWWPSSIHGRLENQLASAPGCFRVLFCEKSIYIVLLFAVTGCNPFRWVLGALLHIQSQVDQLYDVGPVNTELGLMIRRDNLYCVCWKGSSNLGT